MNVLVSSAGHLGALIRLIRVAVRSEGGRVFAVDAAPWSSACRLADGWQVVPRFTDEQFFDAVVSVCRRNNIRMIIPTHERELTVFAKLLPRFEEIGIRVVGSGPRTLAICADKQRTHDFLEYHQLPTTEAISSDHARSDDPALPFPLLVRPREAGSGRPEWIANDVEELRFYRKRTPDPFIERRPKGREFRTSFFVAKGRCVVAVPIWQVEKRGDDVSKCMTVRKRCLLDLANQLAQALPDASGPLCFQAYVDDEDRAQITEVSARFGDGYPVAHQAGADLIKLVLDQAAGRPLIPPNWADGLAMTRWDDAVFWDMRESLRCA